MSYQVIPLIRQEDGTYNLPDEFLAYIWNQLCIENKEKLLFYDGSIKTLQEWLNFIKLPGNFVYFAFNGNAPVHVAWMNNPGPGTVWTHHSSIGKFHRGAPLAIIDLWRTFKNEDGNPTLRLLLGLTPKLNEKAVKFVKTIRFQIVGEIPQLCHLYYENRFCPGIISFLELQTGTLRPPLDKGVLSWAEKAAAAAASPQ